MSRPVCCAPDLGAGGETEHADWKPVVLDAAPASPRCRAARSATAYHGEPGRWNLRPWTGSSPSLTLYGRASDAVAVDLPRFDVGEGEGGGVSAAACPPSRRRASW